jgi:hypothetical protein
LCTDEILHRARVSARITGSDFGKGVR